MRQPVQSPVCRNEGLPSEGRSLQNLGLYEEGGRVGIGTGREGTKGEQRHWSTGERAGGIRSQECLTETQQEGHEGVTRHPRGGKEVKGVGKKVEE